MHTDQKTLAALNGVGGIAVLGSYLLAFSVTPEIRTGLWGGVPDALVPIYTVNMFLAAAGYFPFTALLVLKTQPESLRAMVGVPYRALHVAYGLVLIPSAIWLPLTAMHLEAPSEATWWGIRFVLALVGAGSSALLVLLVALARKRGGALAWAAVIGSIPFWVQTALLDALVWPAYFPR